MERGEFDLIAVGRALIANPDWANRVREDREFTAFEPAMLGELVYDRRPVVMRGVELAPPPRCRPPRGRACRATPRR